MSIDVSAVLGSARSEMAKTCRGVIAEIEVPLDCETKPDGYPVRVRVSAKATELLFFAEPDTEISVDLAELVDALVAFRRGENGE